MSSGTTLLASRGPQQTQQAIGSNPVASNPSLIGQLPTNPTFLKNNAAKMFGGNGIPALGLNSHRNTPPSMPPPTFHQFHTQRTSNPPQRIGKYLKYLRSMFNDVQQLPIPTIPGFPTLDSPLNSDSDFPSLNNTRSSPHNVSNNLFAGQPQLSMLQQQMSMYPPAAAKDVLNSMQHRLPYGEFLIWVFWDSAQPTLFYFCNLANMMRGGVVDNSGYGQTEFSLQNEDFPALPGATQQQLMQSQLGVGGTSGQTNFTESQLMSAGQTTFGGQTLDG